MPEPAAARPHTRPRLALAAVAAAVLAAHGVILLGLPLADTTPAPRPPVAVMQTRALALPAPPPAAPPAASVKASTPIRPAPPPPRPPRPAPPPAIEPLDTPIREHVEPLPPEPELSAAPVEPATPVPEPAQEPVHEADAEAAPPPAAPSEPAQQALPGMQITTPDGQPVSADVSVTVQLPDPVRLSFEVTGQARRFNYSASAELVWRHDGSHYQASQEVSLFLLGSRSQRSEGRITPQGLEPARFDDKARKLQTARLDFGEGRAHFSEGAPDAPIASGAQDRLSVFLQLSALLAGAPQRYAAGTEISFITVSARRADRWTFRVGDSETLELPAGSITALRLDKLARSGSEGDGQQASLWLAPSLQYLPARILLRQDGGDFADLRLKGSGAP